MMTRRSVFAMIAGFFSAVGAKAQQRPETANVMFNACVVNRRLGLNPQECQECGAGFYYERVYTPPTRTTNETQYVNFCPNCGGKNVGTQP